MPDKKVTVSRLEDIVVGEYYHVIGTDSTGVKIPPQVAHVIEPPVRTSAMGVPAVKVLIMAKIGDELIQYTTMLDLWSINVKEGGKGILSGHGMHDRELVRLVNTKELIEFVGNDTYKEAMQSRRETKVLVADKWGNFK